MNSKFSGYSIIFDTYRNDDDLSKHRDIAIYYNDGTIDLKEQTVNEITGCYSTYRYYEKREDFSVYHQNNNRQEIILKQEFYIIMMIKY